jgi:hypothetical protein
MSAIVLKILWIYGLMAVVSMMIAGVIKVIVLLLGRFDRRPEAAAARAQPARAAEVPAAHVAAISAAVYAAIGAHRIVHIEDQRSSGRWGAEGRSAHHHSHAVPTYKPHH